MLQLKQALAISGVKTRDLSKAIFPDAPTPNARIHNFCNLVNGYTKKIDIDKVPLICEMLGVSADYLFGITDYPTRDDEADARREKIASIKEEIIALETLL